MNFERTLAVNEYHPIRHSSSNKQYSHFGMLQPRNNRDCKIHNEMYTNQISDKIPIISCIKALSFQSGGRV